MYLHKRWRGAAVGAHSPSGAPRQGLQLPSSRATARASPAELHAAFLNGLPSSTHVCRGLLSMVPSSRTMPTPILLALPSMPSAMCMAAVGEVRGLAPGEAFGQRASVDVLDRPWSPRSAKLSLSVLLALLSSAELGAVRETLATAASLLTCW